MVRRLLLLGLVALALTACAPKAATCTHSLIDQSDSVLVMCSRTDSWVSQPTCRNGEVSVWTGPPEYKYVCR